MSMAGVRQEEPPHAGDGVSPDKARSPKEGDALQPGQALRPLQISLADAEASPKYFRDAFKQVLSHAPRWVTQHCWRWQKGSLCFLTSTWL